MRPGKGSRSDLSYVVGFLAEIIDEINDFKNNKLDLGLGLKVELVQGRKNLMSVVAPLPISDVEKVLLSIAPKDADGRPITGGTYTWSSSDPSIVSLNVAPDTLSAEAISGAPGAATISVTDGNLTDTILITVTVGIAGSLNLSAGAPVPE